MSVSERPECSGPAGADGGGATEADGRPLKEVWQGVEGGAEGGLPVKIMEIPTPFILGVAQEATEVWEMGREGPVAIPKKKRHTHAAASPPYMAAAGIITVATDLWRDIMRVS